MTNIAGAGFIVGDNLTRGEARKLQRWWNRHPLSDGRFPRELWHHQLIESPTNSKYYAVERLFRVFHVDGDHEK